MALRSGARRDYVDPMTTPVPIPVPAAGWGGIDETVPENLQFNPAQRMARPFRNDDAVTMRGTPVGAAGIKPYYAFNPAMTFHLDDEVKPVPLPPVTQAVRESIFQPFQRWHYQFHINPAWGRHNGRYPRFSFINMIASTGNQEQKLNRNAGNMFGVAGMRPGPRFTRTLRYPRVDATPTTYGKDEGYTP